MPVMEWRLLFSLENSELEKKNRLEFGVLDSPGEAAGVQEETQNLAAGG